MAVPVHFRDLTAGHYRKLLDLSHFLSSHTTVDGLSSALALRLPNVLDFDVVTLGLYDSSVESIRLSIWNASGVQRKCESLPGCASRWSWKNQRSVLLQDLDAEFRVPLFLESLRKVGVRTYYVLPLTTTRRKLGAIGFGSLHVIPKTTQTIDFLHQVAAMTAEILDTTIASDRPVVPADSLGTPSVVTSAPEQQTWNIDLRDQPDRDEAFQEIVGESPALRLDTTVASDRPVVPADSLGTPSVVTSAPEQQTWNIDLRDQPDRDEAFQEIVGESPALREVLKQVATVAATDATVLLLGETGTGKELVAHAVHRLSPRADNKFVSVNCTAIPRELLESELFGHEKGAFTGAVTRYVGRLELADRGTLLLDEVGDLPTAIQPKLLRVLQNKEFERLGSTRTQKVDVRIIAATNQNLHQSIADGRFREDLFYRLNVFPICVPPLRARKSDIPALVRRFVSEYAARWKKSIDTIPTQAMNALVDWNWPGNIRELENFVQRCVILTDSSVLTVPVGELTGRANVTSGKRPEAVERQLILAALTEANGVIGGDSGAAMRLGMKRTTLYSKMKKLNIVPDLSRE